MSLFWIERGMDAAEDRFPPTFVDYTTDFIAATSIAGVDADSDDIAGVNPFRLKRFEGFVGDDWIAVSSRRGSG
jgi:hypothetical protein